jgi:3-methyladenine DNA glycosylase Tag
VANEHRQQPGKPSSDSQYFAEMTKAVFRSGFSWQVIENKWPGFVEAFAKFDLGRVADFDERDFERLVQDERIVRNGRKIQASIDNARGMQSLIAEHGSFHSYLRSLDSMDYPSRAKVLQKQFKFLGRTGTFTFLWYVGEPVPEWEDR